MAKEITKAYILQEMQDRFKLRELTPEIFRFSEEVVPIYNIEQHLHVWESNYRIVSVTGSGPLSIRVVPDNERWTVRAYSVTFMTGAFTIAGVYILRKHRLDATDFSYLDLTAAQSVSYLRTLPEPVVLESGDLIKVNVDGYTSTGNIRIDYDYMREVLR